LWGGQLWPQPPFGRRYERRLPHWDVFHDSLPAKRVFASEQLAADSVLAVRREGRLKGGCSQDWLPHKFTNLFTPN
jgi:hypothetical protein